LRGLDGVAPESGCTNEAASSGRCPDSTKKALREIQDQYMARSVPFLDQWKDRSWLRRVADDTAKLASNGVGPGSSTWGLVRYRSEWI
jgi:hypothetical protein